MGSALNSRLPTSGGIIGISGNICHPKNILLPCIGNFTLHHFVFQSPRIILWYVISCNHFFYGMVVYLFWKVHRLFFVFYRNTLSVKIRRVYFLLLTLCDIWICLIIRMRWTWQSTYLTWLSELILSLIFAWYAIPTVSWRVDSPPLVSTYLSKLSHATPIPLSGDRSMPNGVTSLFLFASYVNSVF